MFVYRKCGCALATGFTGYLVKAIKRLSRGVFPLRISVKSLQVRCHSTSGDEGAPEGKICIEVTTFYHASYHCIFVYIFKLRTFMKHIPCVLSFPWQFCVNEYTSNFLVNRKYKSLSK